MVPPSQSINAWIETNLFQDFATMPTGQGIVNSSIKQINGSKTELKEKFSKRRVTRSMTQRANDSVSYSDSSMITTQYTVDKKDDNINITEPMDDLEEQTAAAQVLQVLRFANVPGDSSPDSSDTSSPSHTRIVDNLVENSSIITLDNNSTSYDLHEWNSEEDELLRNGVNNLGYGNWREIATTIPGRTEDQCKERWDIITLREIRDDPGLNHTYFDPDWGTIAQLDTDTTSTTGTHEGISIDWSGVVNTALLPIALPNNKEVPEENTSPKSLTNKHSRNDNIESFITKDTNVEKIEALNETEISADLLITAMDENPEFFYHSTSNDYPEVSYTAGSETFFISDQTTNISTRSTKVEDPNETNMHQIKRRRSSIPDKNLCRNSPSSNTDDKTSQLGYACLYPHCNKSFARLYNLKSHQRTHSTDRPFKCSSCETAFARNHDLKRHQKIHENTKPYKCLGCKKLFSRLDALKRHKHNPKSRELCHETEVATA
ncbi:putative Metallothionein expression activator [Gigaspora margarita]|uniref:Putative Metallothionein expression activator n=1 Tax=Gigaspora margarita TaxID=4874 RepID=A0A8H4A282_GIGMA|nr:putative Metallothionein expression activator [Gigaspora margarita]